MKKDYVLTMAIFVIKKKKAIGRPSVSTTLEDSGRDSENLTVLYERQYISKRFSKVFVRVNLTFSPDCRSERTDCCHEKFQCKVYTSAHTAYLE